MSIVQRMVAAFGKVWVSTVVSAVITTTLGCSAVFPVADSPISAGSPAIDLKATQKTRTPKNWSIGIVRGADIFSLSEDPSCANPRLTRADLPESTSEFVADPFLIKHSGRWHLFFESFNSEKQKGEIALATSHDLCHWSYGGTVLTATTHLSYPFVFTVGGTYYMVPESRQAGVIQLYRAEKFPTCWKPERVLVKGAYSDASLAHFGGRWWIFANRAPYGLAIFSATALTGEFVEHPQSPLYLDDPSKARPGGRPVIIGGALYRFVQDNRDGYGRRVRLMRVLELNRTAFQEEVVQPDPFLQGSGSGWNGFGMHHVSAEQLHDGSWVAAVDGNSR